MLIKENIPKHVAIVMDGNGRWATQKGLPRMAGHNAGMKALKEAVITSSNLGVEYLTVYAFSTENWKRSIEEVSGIFKLIVIYIDKELAELHKNNVKVKVLGDYSMLPEESVERLNKALATTKDNTGLQLNIALNYGGREEIVNAVRKISEGVKDGSINPDDIDEDTINRNLYTYYMPDPDLIIRPSGELRLSNFLMWQSAYSEFWFDDICWPDFTGDDLLRAISDYQKRNRRYGGV